MPARAVAEMDVLQRALGFAGNSDVAMGRKIEGTHDHRSRFKRSFVGEGPRLVTASEVGREADLVDRDLPIVHVLHVKDRVGRSLAVGDVAAGQRHWGRRTLGQGDGPPSTRSRATGKRGKGECGARHEGDFRAVQSHDWSFYLRNMLIALADDLL